MKIIVNGNPEEINPSTIAQYLELKQINQNYTIVELNQQIIKRDILNQIHFNENDRVEIIRFIGGG